MFNERELCEREGCSPGPEAQGGRCLRCGMPPENQFSPPPEKDEEKYQQITLNCKLSELFKRGLPEGSES